VQTQFKKKLTERLQQPHVPAAKLAGLPNAYKIKLRATGFRLVYEVDDHTVTVTVVVVGKREDNAVYQAAQAHLR
jgi:mRNA interferase RelE/StbE